MSTNVNNDSRKKRKILGIILAVIGFAGVLTCFILFATAGFDAFDKDGGFSNRVLIPFILIIPCALVGGLGVTLATINSRTMNNARAMHQMVMDSYGTKCNNCGALNKKEELFCTSCGKPLKKVCPNCGNECDTNVDFCGKCGSKL